MTRIPELEEELVAAAARLRSPRRALRPALRAALAAAVVAVLVVLAVVGAERNDDGRRPQKTGSRPSHGNVKIGIDVQAGVRFSLEGRQLTVSLFSWTPNDTHNKVVGARIRATCGVAFGQVGPEGDPRNAREERTRLWPAGRHTLHFRFARDISKLARWCRVEDPAVGQVAFVMFGSAPARAPSPTQKIELNANEWARLFAAVRPCSLREVHGPAGLRADGLHARGEPANRELHTAVAGVPEVVPGRTSRGGGDPGHAVRRRQPKQAGRGQVLERQDRPSHKRGRGTRAGWRLVDREVPGQPGPWALREVGGVRGRKLRILFRNSLALLLRSTVPASG